MSAVRVDGMAHPGRLDERARDRADRERAGTERWRKRAAAEGGGGAEEGERDPVVALVSPVDWERAREFGREGVRAEVAASP